MNKNSEPRKEIKVLFVCLGNICRSPAADGILSQLVSELPEEQRQRWTVDSAGTGNYHIGQLPDHRMRIHARRRGFELTHRARQFSVDDFDRFDIIIPMDDANRRDIADMARTIEDTEKIIPISRFFTIATRFDHVPDPYYEGAEGFELVLDLLTDACRNIIRKYT